MASASFHQPLRKEQRESALFVTSSAKRDGLFTSSGDRGVSWHIQPERHLIRVADEGQGIVLGMTKLSCWHDEAHRLCDEILGKPLTHGCSPTLRKAVSLEKFLQLTIASMEFFSSSSLIEFKSLALDIAVSDTQVLSSQWFYPWHQLHVGKSSLAPPLHLVSFSCCLGSQADPFAFSTHEHISHHAIHPSSTPICVLFSEFNHFQLKCCIVTSLLSHWWTFSLPFFIYWHFYTFSHYILYYYARTRPHPPTITCTWLA